MQLANQLMLVKGTTYQRVVVVQADKCIYTICIFTPLFDIFLLYNVRCTPTKIIHEEALSASSSMLYQLQFPGHLQLQPYTDPITIIEPGHDQGMSNCKQGPSYPGRDAVGVPVEAGNMHSWSQMLSVRTEGDRVQE